MKDLTIYFIDLSKLNKEERKSLPQILDKAGENIHEQTLDNLLNDRYDDEYIYLAQFFNGEWVRFNDKLSRTELTYPEFIKLFEGGEGEKVLQVGKILNYLSDRNDELAKKPCFENVCRMAEISRVIQMIKSNNQ